MHYKIDEVEGIGPAHAAKLNEAGIKTTADLLNSCCTAKGRQVTAATEKMIPSWANMANLMRIKGVGRQYAEILHGAGVDTVKVLRTRKADNLAAKMKAVNDAKNLANGGPSAAVVQAWIDAAQALSPTITS